MISEWRKNLNCFLSVDCFFFWKRRLHLPKQFVMNPLMLRYFVKLQMPWWHIYLSFYLIYILCNGNVFYMYWNIFKSEHNSLWNVFFSSFRKKLKDFIFVDTKYFPRDFAFSLLEPDSSTQTSLRLGQFACAIVEHKLQVRGSFDMNWDWDITAVLI